MHGHRRQSICYLIKQVSTHANNLLEFDVPSHWNILTLSKIISSKHEIKEEEKKKINTNKNMHCRYPHILLYQNQFFGTKHKTNETNKIYKRNKRIKE